MNELINPFLANYLNGDLYSIYKTVDDSNYNITDQICAEDKKIKLLQSSKLLKVQYL